MYACFSELGSWTRMMPDALRCVGLAWREALVVLRIFLYFNGGLIGHSHSVGGWPVPSMGMSIGYCF